MQIQPGAKTFFFKLHSGTLSVRTYLEERGFYMPWGSDCLIYRKPETIDHVFLHCWEGVYFWDVLQRTLKKEFPLHPLGIRFLQIENEDGVPFDLIMLLGLHCLWRARMAGFHCDPDRRPARMLFRESIVQYIDVLKQQDFVPDWLARVEPLAYLKEF
uniref:Reverse transcriptase zinc-binding domain-containing protein n=1 Tax=Rhipicephalus pulchellus TaxID=72859 RepID=L7M267_RHIPC